MADQTPEQPAGPQADSSQSAEPGERPPVVATAQLGPVRCAVLADVAPAYAALVDLARLARVAGAVVAGEGRAGTVEISLVVADDATVRGLNARYRGVDRETDVLAFPLTLAGEVFPTPDGVLRLGDVVLSYPRAREQAASEGHGIERELDLLLAHGVLHLLGHEDDTPERRAAMLARGAAVVGGLE